MDAFIIDAVRTPRAIGKAPKGALSHLHPHRLGATVLRALAQQNDIDTRHVDDVIWGTSVQRGLQGHNLGRMAALEAGFDERSSGMTLDRFCGTGITTVSLGAAQVMSGMEDLVVCGGSEMMSHTRVHPELVGNTQLDSENLVLRAQYPQSQQGVCADAIATLEGIDRTAVDALAVASQVRADMATKEGRFDTALVPVLNDDGSVALDRDEFPRPGTTTDTLASLPAIFKKVAQAEIGPDGATFGDMIYQKYPDLRDKMTWVHHAGNASGIVDGAGAVLLASERYTERNRLKPRARVVATANVGDCATLMLNAPVPAIRKVLDKAGLCIADIDIFEINEAFAVVPEKAIRDLNLDRSKVNINGGAIALGHPIGATGAILIGTALDELERSGGRYALITMCAAGGMAPAIIIERI
ncbi:acetyl-CoA C-acetyltransferase [Octadecabacter sp.]|nr:acetyl-CoA C-acetyltransferase [Octadecabacter sp.]